MSEELKNKVATIIEATGVNREYEFRAKRLQAHKAKRNTLKFISSEYINELSISRDEDPQLFDEVIDMLTERYLAKIKEN